MSCVGHTVVSEIFARHKFYRSLILGLSAFLFSWVGSLLVIAHFSFTFSSVLPRRFCIIIGDGIVRYSNSSTPVTTVRCYRSRHNILPFLIFHLGKALAFCQVLSWTFHEFCANFPSSGSNLGDN